MVGGVWGGSELEALPLALLLVGLFGGLLLRELVGAPARSGSAYIDMQGLYGDRGGAWAGGVPLGRWLAWPPASATCRLRALVAEVESTRLALPRLLAVDDGVTAIAAVASHHVVRLDAKGHRQHGVAVRALHCVWAPLGRLGRRPRSFSGFRVPARIGSEMSQGDSLSCGAHANVLRADLLLLPTRECRPGDPSIDQRRHC